MTTCLSRSIFTIFWRWLNVTRMGDHNWFPEIAFWCATPDLRPGDFVRVECACGHEEMIPAVTLTQGLRLAPDARVVDLEPRLRCRECDAKGRAAVSVR